MVVVAVGMGAAGLRRTSVATNGEISQQMRRADSVMKNMIDREKEKEMKQQLRRESFLCCNWLGQ